MPAAPATDQTDELASDPWNAICVVGLRVYAKGSQAEIKVVRAQDDDNNPVENKKLDVDDQAADATKKLQKLSTVEEGALEGVSGTPAGIEESRQG